MPTGCSFHPRCPKRFEPCPDNIPVLGRPDTPDGGTRTVACWLHPVTEPVG
jgi:ABC-type dipeptide/oligopeptide/nickel transport system ATPase component